MNINLPLYAPTSHISQLEVFLTTETVFFDIAL